MNFQYVKKISALGMVVAYLSGCASPTDVANMTLSAQQPMRAEKAGTYFQNLSVSKIDGGSETNPMWMSKVSNEDFKCALKTSLQNNDYLGDDMSSKYVLNANLVTIDQPLFGFNMTVRSAIEYTVLEQSSQKEVLKEKIESLYTATPGDAFVGMTRLRLATEGSIKQNMIKLLSKLKEEK